MENMRQKFDLTLRPVGRSSQPRKGAVCEDLGRTSFTSGRHPLTKHSQKTLDSDLPESDDDLDVLSSKNRSSSLFPPSHKTKVLGMAEKPNKSKGSTIYASRKKNRQISKVNEVVDDENASGPSKPPRARPKPRPLNKMQLDSEDMPPSNQLALESKRSRKISSDDGLGNSPLEELSPNRVKRPKTSNSQTRKTIPDPFPMSSPERAVQVKKHFPKHSPRKPARFPVDARSPGSSIHKRKATRFPVETSSPSQKLPSLKSKAPQPFPLESPLLDDNHSEDDLQMKEDDAILTYGGIRPFPMGASQFPSKLSPIPKRTRRRSSLVPHDFGELSLDGDETVDPSTICPFCDEPWPSEPSPTLVALLERTKRKSYPDPRHGNALGLKAPLTAFVELCQRHRFEMNHLPLAIERGWPRRIDFASLPKRIGAFRKELKRLLDRPTQSKFWRELRDDAKEVGAMKVVSVTGQYATFERTQPGYYGEQGSVIIHQCLYSMFPPDSITTTSVLPLTPDQFLTRVLVPETALLLIQHDMHLPTKEEAMEVLDESKQYGVSMFPEQAQDDEVAEVGEKLARDRATARRKVLEERGEADADVRREVEKEKRQARKAKANEKGSSKVPGKRKATVQHSNTDSEPAEERKTKGQTGQRRAHHILKTRDDWTEEESDLPAPRPAKAAKNFREPSTTSWRSNRSQSTSPAPSPLDCSSSLFAKGQHAAPSSSQITRPKVVSSPWSYRMHDNRCSSEPEDVNQEDVETIIISRDKSAAKAEDDMDSDVLIILDTKTPKPRPKARMVARNITTRSVLNGEENSSETMSYNDHARRGRTDRENVGAQENGVKHSLGQTKRRKKTASQPQRGTSQRNEDSWLLSDD